MAAFDKYIVFLQYQKPIIRDYDNNDDLVSLIQMYSSLPKERQTIMLKDGNAFTDLLAWESLTYEVDRVLKNRTSRNKFINLALFAAGGSTFFIPTVPLFGFFITAAWIGKGVYNLFKQHNLIKNDITFWLSGVQPYRAILDRQHRIRTEAVMIIFFGFSLAPVISRVGSVDKELFTLKADEVETFMTNILEYGKARLKWKSKSGIAASGDLEDDIFDVYIKTEGNLSFYIPKVVIDFNDYQILNSGCLINSNCIY